MKHLLLTTIAAVLLVGCGLSEADRALIVAAEKGNIEAVKQHLDAGADVNAKNEYGYTPLHWAADEGHKEVVELLIAEGADVNAMNDVDGTTPLDMATFGDHNETADLLRKNGGKTWEELEAAEPVTEAAQPEPSTAKAPDISIHDAARDGNIEAIKQHLAAGTDANEVERKLIQQSKEYIPMSRRDSALDLALKLPSSSDKSVIVNMLRKNGGKTTKQLSNQDALTSACLSGNMMTIKKLIKDGAHINSKGRTGVTPLNIAVYSGNRKVVNFLLDNGADANFEDKEGYAPLHNVMLKEDAELLIKNGADMRAKTNKGQTPLHTAAILRHLEIIELLVSSGVEVNPIDKSGQTPFDYAKMWDTASAEEKEIANTLLRDNNVDSNSKINKSADLLRKHGGKTGEELKAEGK